MSSTSLSEMPFFNISTSQLLEDVLYNSNNIKQNICESSEFYNNILKVCDNNVLQQLQFAYSTESHFNNLVTNRPIQLSVFHLNIRSLNKNINGLLHYLRLFDIEFDVLVLSEIWKYNLEFYCKILKNYHFYYSPPVDTNVGGVGIFVKDTFVCNRLDHLNLPSTKDGIVENLWLEIINNENRYIVGGVYRHPGYNIKTFCTNLESSVEHMNKSNIPCIIAGDFNIDLTKYDKNRDTSDFLNSLLINNFMPMIILPTRITKNSSTLIDHIFYREGCNNTKDLQTASGNLWCDLTDHLPNYFLIFDNQYTQKNVRPLIRIFSEKNIKNFQNEVCNINWEPLYDTDDVNQGYNYLDTKIKQCYLNNFKLVRLSRNRAKDKIWITPGLKCSSKHKNKLYKKWLKSKSPSDEEKYKTYRRLYKQLLKETKKVYYRDLFDSRTNSVKQLWNNLNHIVSLGKNKGTNNIQQLRIGNDNVQDSNIISNYFNDYFCSIGLSCQNKFNQNNCNDFKDYLPPPFKNSMYCFPVSKDEINKIISKFQNKKSPGPDNITPKLLKAIKDEISDPLLYLFNLSFSSGIVPNLLKTAKVIPVYKKGDKSIVSNYRPISLLSIFDKILEKLMYSRLYNYLCANNILSDNQFGFRRNHSTCLALINVMDDIYEHIDSNDKVLAIYLDLQKAFDCIDHNILLYKMNHIGIRGTVYNWFKNYLYNRIQYVTVNGVNSDFSTLKCGVPQGSVLGPLLFLLYVNDVGNSVPNIPVKLYADDTNLFIYGKTTDILINDAQSGLTKLIKWFSDNKLSLSVDKTCFSAFGVPDCDKNKLKLKINNDDIKQVKSTKYLGIIIDSNLTWEDHIDYLYKKNHKIY